MKNNKSKGNNQQSDSDGGTPINIEKKVKGKVQIKEENNTIIEHDPKEKASKTMSRNDNSKEKLKTTSINEHSVEKYNEIKEKENTENTKITEPHSIKNLTVKSKSSIPKEHYENIRVLIRVRPLNKFELGKGNSIYLDSTDDKKIKIGKDSQFFEASFDKVFGNFTLQEDIFNHLTPALDRVLVGFNCTIFTYGQTGSGKTYTMFGGDWTKYDKLDGLPASSPKQSKRKDEDIYYDFSVNPYSEENGIIPRSINHIYSEVEMKNLDKKEKKDETEKEKKTLEIKEDKDNGIIVEGLSEHLTENLFDCLNLLKKGEKNRKRRQTKKNDFSSRSHTIFQIIIQNELVNEKGILKRTKLNLCDLAGSEKLEKGDEMIEKMHFNEMININLSLTTLGKVIHSLATKQSHIPYRDSKLTRLLQDSLGGNTVTFLISTLSPSILSYEETISTLKFSDRAKNVMTKVKPNETNQNRNEIVIKKLKEEIDQYKNILNLRKKRGNFNELEDEVLKLRTENTKLKQYMTSNSELEKLVEENRCLKKEVVKYRPDYFEHKLRGQKNVKNDDEAYYYDKYYQEQSSMMSKNDLDNFDIGKSNLYDHYSNDYSNSDYQVNDSYLDKISNSSSLYKVKKTSSPKKYEVNNKYINNHNYGMRSRSNLIKSGEMVLHSNNSYKEKDMKAFNDKLRILEKLEIETGLNLQKEKEKVYYQKLLIKDERNSKNVSRQHMFNKAEDQMNKIKYPYKDSNDDLSYEGTYENYKKKSFNKKYYNDIINSNDREYIDNSLNSLDRSIDRDDNKNKINDYNKYLNDASDYKKKEKNQSKKDEGTSLESNTKQEKKDDGKSSDLNKKIEKNNESKTVKDDVKALDPNKKIEKKDESKTVKEEGKSSDPNKKIEKKDDGKSSDPNMKIDKKDESKTAKEEGKSSDPSVKIDKKDESKTAKDDGKSSDPNKKIEKKDDGKSSDPNLKIDKKDESKTVKDDGKSSDPNKKIEKKDDGKQNDKQNQGIKDDKNSDPNKKTLDKKEEKDNKTSDLSKKDKK